MVVPRIYREFLAAQMGIETANDGGLIRKETCLGGVDPRKRQGLMFFLCFLFYMLQGGTP